VRYLPLIIATVLAAVALFFLIVSGISSAGSNDVQIPVASVWGVLADALNDIWFWGVFIFGSSFLAVFVRHLNREMMGGLPSKRWGR